MGKRRGRFAACFSSVLPSGRHSVVFTGNRTGQDEFRRRLREEWKLLWRERFDDKVRAEGVSIRDYPLLFVDRGVVVFAVKGAKSPSYSDIIDFWVSQGLVYSPDPLLGGWGKFIRTELERHTHTRASTFNRNRPRGKVEKQQSKKGGRGWLHK
jgi:hypothetical protein